MLKEPVSGKFFWGGTVRIVSNLSGVDGWKLVEIISA